MMNDLLSWFCAQDPARAYAPGGEAFPLCARCLGVYVGLLTGLAWWAFARPRGRLPFVWTFLVLLAFAQMAVLGFGAMHGRFDLSADARCASGGFFGGAVVLGLASMRGEGTCAGWCVLPLFPLSIGVPLAVGHWCTPSVAALLAVLGACGGLLAANYAVLSRTLLRRPSPALLSAVVLLAGEVLALHAWRGLWRA